MTNSLSQIVTPDSVFSQIDLGDCEKKLKQLGGLSQDTSLIFLKFENIANSGNERDIQYEVYNPSDYSLLNLSVCQNTKIKMMISVEISDELAERPFR